MVSSGERVACRKPPGSSSSSSSGSSSPSQALIRSARSALRKRFPTADELLASLELLLPDTTRMHEVLMTAGFAPSLRTGHREALRFTLDCPKGRVTFSP